MNQTADEDIINSATPLELDLIDQHPRLHLDEARLAFLREHCEEEPWAGMLAVAAHNIAATPA